MLESTTTLERNAGGKSKPKRDGEIVQIQEDPAVHDDAYTDPLHSHSGAHSNWREEGGKETGGESATPWLPWQVLFLNE